MDELERLAEDLAQDHPGREITITSNDLTYVDFLGLQNEVAKRELSIKLHWWPMTNSRKCLYQRGYGCVALCGRIMSSQFTARKHP